MQNDVQEYKHDQISRPRQEHSEEGEEREEELEEEDRHFSAKIE